MKGFYLIARTISYTFAVAFYTIITGVFALVTGAFLGTSYVLFPYERYMFLFQFEIPVALGIVSVIYFIQMGLFTPIKIPAFMKNHRKINRAFKANLNIEKEELHDTYLAFTDLVMHNFMAGILACATVGLIVFGIVFYKHHYLGIIPDLDYRIIVRVLVVCMISILIFMGMCVYLLSEYVTSNERTHLYNEILRAGIMKSPQPLIGVRVKFFIFVVLMLTVLLSFAAMVEKTRFFRNFDIRLIVVYFVLSFVLGIVMMQVTTNSIVNLMSDLRRVIKIIAGGGRAAFGLISLEKEFASIEFGLMEMAWEIDEHRKNLEMKVEERTLELQNVLSDLKTRDDQIQKQLDMASVIQRSILPGKIDDWNELKFSIRYLAMEKIGGDFYDVHQLKDDKLGIMIADVSGHGIPAALVTTMAKISFDNAGQNYDSPRKIFQEVNQNILDHVKTQDYMTCFMVAIDDEYNVVYSNASHQKAILLRTEQAEIEELDTNGLFIGAIEEARDTYEEKVTSLHYGDRLILYTDGIPEALNESRKEFSIERLCKVAIDNRSLELEAFSDAIIKSVQKFVGNAAVEDDITLLVIELARDEAVDMVKNARKLVNAHQYYDAISLLENGLEKFPENQKIQYALAKNYFRVNNFNRAMHYIEKYLESDRRNKYALYIAGASCYQMMDYPGAIEHFEHALDLDPNFVNALFAMGMSQKKKGDYTAAEKIFERVINLDSDNKMALFELKLIRKEGGKPGA